MIKPFFEMVQQDDKYILDVSGYINHMFQDFHRKLERLCEEDFDQMARKFGYVKSEPSHRAGQIVISHELAVWLADTFNESAQRAYGSKFDNPDYVAPVFFIHGRKCLDVANELTAAIQGAANDRCGADNGR